MVLDQHRRRALRRHQQELAPSFPRPLLDELRLDPHFAQNEPDEPGMAAEGMMIESDHRDAGVGRLERRRRRLSSFNCVAAG